MVAVLDWAGTTQPVVINGPNQVTFSGNSTNYQDPTQVNSGTLSLQLGNSGSTFNSAIDIASGATLDLTTAITGVDNWVFDTAISGVAGSNITKNGSGWTQFAMPADWVDFMEH